MENSFALDKGTVVAAVVVVLVEVVDLGIV